MKIMKLTIDDVKNHKKELISMLKQSFKSSFPGQDFSEESYENRIESLKNFLKENKAIIFGCKKTDILIGFIWFFRKDSNTIHINHFVVDEQYRRLGVGKLLWNQVEEHAINEKLIDIELFVTKENDSAVNFYTKRDFEIDRFVMKKRLFK